jgi:hypothetical protein
MPRSKRNAHHRVAAGVGCAAALTAGLLLFLPMAVDAQNRPPLQEPIALEGTIKQFYRGANVVIVTTMDGMEHVYQFTKNLIVHGGRKPGVDAFEGLRDGTTVVIHFTESGPHAAAEEIDLLGDEGLKMTEGVVADIDRRKKEITIRYGNGRTETLQMTDRVAAESVAGIEESSEEAAHVVIYYTDESGRKVAHYFKKGS